MGSKFSFLAFQLGEEQTVCEKKRNNMHAKFRYFYIILITIQQMLPTANRVKMIRGRALIFQYTSL